MNSGEIHGWHYSRRQPIRVVWNAGLITAIESSDAAHAHNVWIAPPLFDLQINGYGGIDFQSDGLTSEQLLRAARQLRRDGCARFLFTLVTDDRPQLMQRLRHARGLREGSSELKQAIAGWHIEGPFLSDRPGFHGAHDPACMIDPKPEHIRELRELTGNDPVLVTIAPERNAALPAIQLATSLGMKVSLGHTDASGQLLADAVRAGATGFTHLANGCPRDLDRHDNIIWRVCETAGLTVSFIADGIHVSPAPFRLMHRLLEKRNIYYTTDAMSAAGAPPGKYRLGKLELEVGADQIVRYPGKTNFAGSALRPIDGVFRAAKMLSVPWQECWRRFSEAPGDFIGCPRRFEIGAPATFCSFEMSENERPSLLRTWIEGRPNDL